VDPGVVLQDFLIDLGGGEAGLFSGSRSRDKKVITKVRLKPPCKVNSFCKIPFPAMHWLFMTPIKRMFLVN